MQQPWPLVKGNGFILVAGGVRMFTGNYLSSPYQIRRML
jgi:hypothetical protein